MFEAGRHEFFREPTEAERRTLLSSDPAECQRYKAALELKKKIAKAAAEKRRKAQAARLAKLKAKRSRYAGPLAPICTQRAGLASLGGADAPAPAG